jgi:nucleoside-diphosphate-sugar epimerase
VRGPGAQLAGAPANVPAVSLVIRRRKIEQEQPIDRSYIMRLFLTGGTGVLGRALRSLAGAEGHQLLSPTHADLDLFDPSAVAAAVTASDAILHLATRIPPPSRMDERQAWNDNDRIRTEASRILVDAGLAADVCVYVQPTVTFVYPDGIPVDEDTPLGDTPEHLRSALAAEQQTARFANAGRRGVVLRLGLLDGPGTGNEQPNPSLGASLHVSDAAQALLAALTAPSGTYNVCRDGERVSNTRFRQATGWYPRR